MLPPIIAHWTPASRQREFWLIAIISHSRAFKMEIELQWNLIAWYCMTAFIAGFIQGLYDKVCIVISSQQLKRTEYKHTQACKTESLGSNQQNHSLLAEKVKLYITGKGFFAYSQPSLGWFTIGNTALQALLYRGTVRVPLGNVWWIFSHEITPILWYLCSTVDPPTCSIPYFVYGSKSSLRIGTFGHARKIPPPMFCGVQDQNSKLQKVLF